MNDMPNLVQWRRHRFLRLRQVAAMMELSSTAFSRVESGIVPLDDDVRRKLAVIYGCGPSELDKAPPPHTVDDLNFVGLCLNREMAA